MNGPLVAMLRRISTWTRSTCHWTFSRQQIGRGWPNFGQVLCPSRQPLFLVAVPVGAPHVAAGGVGVAQAEGAKGEVAQGEVAAGALPPMRPLQPTAHQTRLAQTRRTVTLRRLRTQTIPTAIENCTSA